MDCNCGFRKLISLTVSYSKFPFCCLQHLKLGDIFVSHEADILSFTSTMQFLHFHSEQGPVIGIVIHCTHYLSSHWLKGPAANFGNQCNLQFSYLSAHR